MACSARALALSVSLAALAGEASGFDCGNCASQIFTESGTFTAAGGPARVFALAVGGGAGGAKLGGGASGVAVSGVIDLPSASTEVTVGAGGEPFSTGGTAGYNGGNNNLQDDVSATDGQPSIIGSLMAAGGDGEEDSMGGIGSGGSGGGHYGTPNGNPGGSAGSDGTGPCCFGTGQGAESFQTAIDLQVDGISLTAGAAGDGGYYGNSDWPGAEAGGGGGGGVLLNGAGPTVAAQDGTDSSVSGKAGTGYGAGGGAGGGSPGYNYKDGGRAADGVVIVVYCPAGSSLTLLQRSSYTCQQCRKGACTPSPPPPPVVTECTSGLAEFGDLVAEDCPPAAFGRMVPDSCPPTCSAMFVPWWASCGRPGELLELDQVPGLRDAPAGFDGLCGGSGDGGTGGHH